MTVGINGAWAAFLREGLALLAVFAVLALPGGLLCSRLLARRGLAAGERRLVAVVAGLFSGSLLAVPLVMLIGLRPGLILGFYLGAAALLAVRRRLPAGGPKPPVPVAGRSGALAFLLCLGLLTAATLRPWSRITELTPRGYAVRQYFAPDYLKHVMVTTALAKGRIPPENPAFAGETLHYYWLGYIPSALAGRLLGPAASPLRITVAYSMCANLLLLAALFVLFAAYVSDRCGRLAGLFALLFASSYEGAVLLLRMQHDRRPFDLMRSYNVDGLTRWYWGHPQIDTLYRSFLYTPQAQLALAALCLLLVLLRRREAFFTGPRREVFPALIIAGLLGGAVFGFNFFIGAVVLPWWLLALVLAMPGQGLRSRAAQVAVPFLVLAACLAAFRALGMFLPGGGGTFAFAGGGRYFALLPRILLLNFGPLLILGGAGAWLAFRDPDGRRVWFFPGLLAVVSLGWLAFVRIEQFPSDVALKSGHAAALALALFTAQAAGWLRRRWGWKGGIALLFLVIPAAATVPIDAYNAQDIANRRFTVYFQPEEFRAARWIARNTPQDWVVQGLPDRDSEFCDLLTTFAERRTAVGDQMHAQIYLQDAERYRRREAEVQEVFTAPDAATAVARARRLGIDGLFVGNEERTNRPEFAAAVAGLPPLYAAPGVTILQVAP